MRRDKSGLKSNRASVQTNEVKMPKIIDIGAMAEALMMPPGQLLREMGIKKREQRLETAIKKCRKDLAREFDTRRTAENLFVLAAHFVRDEGEIIKVHRGIGF